MEGAAAGGRNESGDEVMSEIHLGCPPHFSGPYITQFTFSLPTDDDSRAARVLDLDDDGDLVLVRRNVTSSVCKLTFQHRIMSSVPNVGLQVWMAALVLSDYIIHRSFVSSDFDGVTAIELGAGTGLTGVVLARVAKTIFLTDYGNEILENCAKNVDINISLLGLNVNTILVRELNWKDSWPPHNDLFQCSRYSWSTSEVGEAEGATVIIAADVIYSDKLTDSFFCVLEKLMSRGSRKVLYLALEKRYNFSLDDLDVVANGYERFKSFLKTPEECSKLGNLSLPCFMGEQINLLEIPQYIREYERGKDVELWRIQYCTRISDVHAEK
ncbi:hypothetical protein HPP92_003725 [Vanilla planifolia]|uniref:Methyltransferase-like protein 22 n=1 Tax=Vanilla planifolia TaxID=51239 RepID=A0A835S0I2_VANPL|nr:hypothetical protein HPP92_003725 [Vanilla planifolia]